MDLSPDTEQPYLSRRQNWITQLERHALMQPDATALRFMGQTKSRLNKWARTTQIQRWRGSTVPRFKRCG